MQCADQPVVWHVVECNGSAPGNRIRGVGGGDINNACAKANVQKYVAPNAAKCASAKPRGASQQPCHGGYEPTISITGDIMRWEEE